MSRKLSICFVSLRIYPLLKKEWRSQVFGGAEYQQYLIGRSLVSRGHEVSIVTSDVGQGTEEWVEPFRVLGAFEPDAGQPGLRFFYPRLTGILRALRRADADIYFVRCASFILGPVVWMARRMRKKVVYSGASDLDFDPKGVLFGNHRDRMLYWWGLRRCDLIVVQSAHQEQAAREALEVPCKVIHNALEAPDTASVTPETVLWVGVFREEKQPGLFIELARRFPEVAFVMVGGPTEGKAKSERLYQEAQKAAADLPNLTITGFVVPERVDDYIRSARVLVNTSRFEGFPNTFLQAWARGLPTLSFVDPDGIVERNRLGWVVDSPEQMNKALASYLSGSAPVHRETLIKYFRENHELERQVTLYEEALGKLVP